MNPESDNFNLRLSCILGSDFDILGLAETHLVGENTISINGYSWYGLNRKKLHRKARNGSGGVGFFINSTLIEIFNIQVLNSSCKGILWLKMGHKFDDFTLIPCVCYLPPEN